MNAVDLIVEDEAWNSLGGLSVIADAALAAACEEIAEPEPGVVALLLASDETLARLNAEFRGKAGPTNVLSFPATELAENHLGDIAIAWGVVEREASERGIAVEDHLKHLIVHGFLHLQGYDHQTDDEAELMEGMERRALARIGVQDPYAHDNRIAKGGPA